MLPARGLRLWTNESGYETEFRRLDLHFDSPRPADVDTIREAMRGVLGAERDRTAHASLAASNIQTALPLDPPRARRWLAEAKALGAQSTGWKELLALAAQLEGSSPGLLAQRLREAPHDPSAWREATADTNVAQHVLDEVRRRFTAPAPLEGWRRLEDGLGPIPSRQGLHGALESALWGDALPYESGVVTTASEQLSRRTLRAAWAAGELPRMAIEETVLGDGEATTTVHLWDDTTGDGVALRWVTTGPRRIELHLGYAAAAVGSPEFQARAWLALESLSPCRWESTKSDALFTERTLRDRTRVSRALPRHEQVLTLLELLSEPALPEVRALLAECQCTESPCTHAKRAVDLQRASVRSVSEATLRADECTALARSAALDAFVALVQKRSDGVEASITRVEKHLATRDALRPGVAVRDVRP